VETRRPERKSYAIVYLDGFNLKVRLAKRVVSVPVLAALEVSEDRTRQLVCIRLAVSAAAAHWSSLVEDV
jgi:transposase-like protein